jgi:hypothetical protein
MSPWELFANVNACGYLNDLVRSKMNVESALVHHFG